MEETYVLNSYGLKFLDVFNQMEDVSYNNFLLYSGKIFVFTKNYLTHSALQNEPLVLVFSMYISCNQFGNLIV